VLSAELGNSGSACQLPEVPLYSAQGGIPTTIPAEDGAALVAVVIPKDRSVVATEVPVYRFPP